MPSDAPVPATPLLRLTYAIGTQPLPLQASPAGAGPPPRSTLTLLATNGTGAAVALAALQVTLPIGPGADELTDVVPPGWMVPAGWAQKALGVAGGKATYTFEPTPGSGAGSVAAGESLVFVLNGVQVNARPGTVQVKVTEGSGGCGPPDCPCIDVPVTKVPAGGTVVSFWATPTEVAPGGSTVLGWRGPAGATCTLSYYDPERGQITIPRQGDPPLSYDGEYPGSTDPPLVLRETTVFTLNVAMAAEGEKWSGQQQVAVVVGIPAPVITSLTGQLSGPPNAPSLTLAWTTEHANWCRLTGVNELQAPSGSHTIQAPLEKTYTLTAGRGDLAAPPRTFAVPPYIASFGGTLALGASGVELTLSWNAPSADSCVISGVPGTFSGPTGSHVLKPTAADPLVAAYTLTARGPAGATPATATAHVQWPGGEQRSLPYTQIGSAALSPDGTRLYRCNASTGASPELVALSIPGLRTVAKPVRASADAMAACPAGRTVLTANASGDTMSVYDARTLERVVGPAGVGQTPMSIRVSPDGATAFVACVDEATVWVIDTSTLNRRGKPLPASQGAELHLALSPDGGRLYAAGSIIQSWTVSGGGWVAGPATKEQWAGPLMLAPSPDGKRLYVLRLDDATLRVLDAGTLQPVMAPLALPGSPREMAVSRDGTHLFVGGNPGPVTVVDAATLRPLGEIASSVAANMMAATPDGAALVVVDGTGSVLVYVARGYST